MRIAFFHHTLRVGSGIDTVIYELATRLARKCDVSVYCFRSDYDHEKLNFELKTIKSRLTDGTNRTMMIAPFLLDKVSPFYSELELFDIVNTHHYPANFICRNLEHPLRIVTEWSGVSTSMFSTLKEKAFVAWAKYANKVAAKKADLLISPCDFVSNWIRETYGIESTTLLLDGISFDKFNREKINHDKFYQLYPHLKGKKIILFVGRITESKNIHTLIKIFSRLKKCFADSALVLVGDYQSYPTYFDYLNKVINSTNTDDIVFAGVVQWSDLPSFFAASDLYATCSLWEGFLRAEAFAFGKPIICFNVGANSETVRNEENGFIIEELDESEFASCMLKLLHDKPLALSMGERGYKWARQNLDFENIADRFFELSEANIGRRVRT